MAGALAYLAPGVFGVGGSVALVSAGGLTLLGSAANILGGLALSVAGSALFSPDTGGYGPESIKINVAADTNPRIVHFGRVRVGYAIVFTRAKAGKLYQIIVHGHGEFDAIEAFYLDKGLITLDANGFAEQEQYQRDGRSHVQVVSRLGQVPQDVLAELAADFYEWSTDHRLDGLACSLVIAELPPLDEFNAMFPNREPVLEVVARTSKVYDPRTGQTAFSENAALCALAYEVSADGGNLAGRVDVDSYAAAADVCDEPVALASGGTEPRYRVALSYGLDEAPADVRARFAAACAGENFITPEGKLGFRAGAWYQPRFTLTEAAVLTLDWSFGDDAVSGYNVAAFQYVDPALNYAQVSGDPFRDEARIALYGEIVQSPVIAAPSHRQCRAVSEITMMRDNPAQRLKVTCKPMALEALYEPAISVDLPHYGVSGVFRVDAVSVDPVSLRLTFDLALVNADAFLVPLSEQGVPPTFNALSDSVGVPAVTGFNAGPSGVATSQSTFAAGIAAAWNAAPYDSLAPHLEYTVSGADDWQSVSVAAAATSAQITGLADGVAYDVRLAWRSPGDALGPFVQENAITAQAVTGTPAAPTALAVADQGGGQALVSFTASATAGHWKTEILRDGVLVASIPGEPGQAGQFVDAPGFGSFDWTARAVNLSAVQSAQTAPVSLTLS